MYRIGPAAEPLAQHAEWEADEAAACAPSGPACATAARRPIGAHRALPARSCQTRGARRAARPPAAPFPGPWRPGRRSRPERGSRGPGLARRGCRLSQLPRARPRRQQPDPWRPTPRQGVAAGRRRRRWQPGRQAPRPEQRRLQPRPLGRARQRARRPRRRCQVSRSASQPGVPVAQPGWAHMGHARVTTNTPAVNVSAKSGTLVTAPEARHAHLELR